MILSEKTLEKLRVLINEDTEYRSGPKLVQFFNDLGFQDSYGQGFPSRWIYTDEKLNMINGSPRLDRCIKKLFAPINFVGDIPRLDALIAEFNKYMVFDKWTVKRLEAEIIFEKKDKVVIDVGRQQGDPEDDFLRREFNNVEFTSDLIDPYIADVLKARIKEIEDCYPVGAYLSVIFLAGSTLEGFLLGVASKYPKAFNTTKSSPKDNSGKIKQFHEWSLSSFIEVVKELGLIEYDTYRFSHTLRDFRNYIHPYQQLSTQFKPREHTAKICLQVLKASITELNGSITKLNK
ncbi:hypothetical protein [Dickeya zeae]|uniref:hypothetical protein n=1 Tax=Dickeya zeae TaxID=204042 RepID=UPI000361A20A|nr:hypothetical protein [Dickeya zeae]UJR55049.1 hypothetical protein J417_13960 [Dickeya zeae MS1]